MNARHEKLSNADYHAHPAHGSSMMELFRTSRRDYHAVHVAKTQPPKPPSPAMEFGTVVHWRLLEPHKLKTELADPPPEVAPDGTKWLKRKGSDHERWWAEYVESTEGKIVMTQYQLDAVEAIAKSVENCWHARALIAGRGEPEFSIFWTDAATGLELKCRVDWMARIPVDLKTTRDPSPRAYARQVVNLGYHRKRAHYGAGLSAYLNEADPPFVHLTLGTEKPHTVAVYELDDTDSNGRSLGRDQWRWTLNELARCYDSDDWREPWERRIVRLGLPGYAYHEDHYQFAGEPNG